MASRLNTLPDFLCVCVLCLTCQMMADIRIRNEDGGRLPGDGPVPEPPTCISERQVGRRHDGSETLHEGRRALRGSPEAPQNRQSRNPAVQRLE